MITALITVAAMASSCLGIAYLVMTDAKRRRAFKLPPVARHRPPWAWPAVYMPGLVLLILDQWAAVMMWLGAMPLMGWAIAVTPPAAYARLGAGVEAARINAAEVGNRLARTLAGRARTGPRDLAPPGEAAQRIAALECRVAALEALLIRPAADGTAGDTPASEPARETAGADPELRLPTDLRRDRRGYRNGPTARSSAGA